jgi:hypothetical protein
MDIRGLALKILGVLGDRMRTNANDATASTQDFLMANQPFGPAADARHMMGFASALLKVSESTTILGKVDSLVSAGGFLAKDENVRLVDFLANHALPKAKAVGTLVGDSFFTGAPNAMGLAAGDPETARAKGAFKVMAKTGVLRGNVCTPTEQKPTADENYLRADLVKQLANAQVCIDIFLQFQENADSEPIEDVSVEWKTPFVKAGRIVFAKQQLEDTDQGRCDSFSFQPWHTLQVHKPLGNVMRARRIALPASASYRGADLTEPTE